jgi:hypothetical protein
MQLLKSLPENLETSGVGNKTDALIHIGIWRDAIGLSNIIIHRVPKRHTTHINLGSISICEHNGIATREATRILRIGSRGINLHSSWQHTQR